MPRPAAAGAERRASSARQVPSDDKRAVPSKLPTAKLLSWERKGWCITKGLLKKELIAELREEVKQHVSANKLSALQHRVRVLCPGVTPESIKSERQAMKLLATSGVDEVGFLQFFHLHRSRPVAHRLVFSPELAGTAAQLLGAPKVRVYQDCVFLKEPGYAATNWHSDLRMAPFDTNAFATAWVPLRPIQGSEDDSGLLFAEASHRDFALPFWHELQGLDLSNRYSVTSAGFMAEGDVTWHHGWTLHYAPPQPPGTAPRLALAVSFFADGARLLRREGAGSTVREQMQEGEDLESYANWVGQMKDGAVARHELLPVAYPL